MKNKKTKEKRELKAISFLEIFILVVATIAFSWMIGSQIETVSASDGDSCRACVGSNVYSGIENDGSCDITNGILISTCTSSQACIGGVCTENDDEPEDENQKDLLDNRIVQAGIDVLAAEGYSLAKDALRKYIQKNSASWVSKLFGAKTGEVASQAASQTLAQTSSATVQNMAEVYAGQLAPTPGVEIPSSGFFSGQTGSFAGIFGQFLMNAAAAAATALVINYFAKKFASDRNFNDIRLVTWLSVVPGAGIGLIGMSSLGILAGMGIAAAVVALAFGAYMLVGYQLYSREAFNYRVSMWQPPIGGADCEKCNSLTLGLGDNKVSGCSEYICHTYGAACMWVNDETEYESCMVTNPNDGAYPHITPAKEINGEEVLPTSQYDYQSSAASTRIVYNGEGGGTNKCVPAYTPITIALTTNEEADCRVSLEPTTGTPEEAFKTMLPMAEGTVYVKNHTLQLPTSVSATQQALTDAGYSINNGGNYRFYIRCSDYWGNINSVDYTMQFCVQMGPDRRPPEIIETNPETESYIKAGTTYIEDFQVYTNEPADCKWDTRRVNYNYMTYNFSRCSQRIDDYIAGFDYGCRTNLTQFTNGQENRYYIACRDNPQYKGNVTKEAQRNTGTPYEVVLKGTSRLMIQNVRINGKQNGTEIRSAEENMDVKLEVFTSNGAENGKAKCLYSINSNDEGSYSLFFNDGSLEYLTTNTEELYMPEGNYIANIKCLDLAENVAETFVNFSVEVDLLSPAVVRAYKDEASNSLKIITDEIAECVYSTTTCTYDIEDGTSIDTDDGLHHYIEWDSSRDLYIRCADEYGNKPFDGSCSIILRPFEIAQVI